MIPPIRSIVPGVLIAAAIVPLPAAAARPAPATLALGCSGCHGTGGKPQGITPVLAGKPEGELLRSLRDFKSGRRKSSIMNRIAAGYQDSDLVELAHHFATGGSEP
ncbi:MAG: c-type cytochrome [Methylococcaceae bacterium]|nr:c-type cytochrome [Methylococcaceae bacterium]